jgi:NitT/TauT family transport system substrate-binding protein
LYDFFAGHQIVKETSMRKWMIGAALAALVLVPASANAADKITIQLKWLVQTQFAGYYVALDKGFYKDVGLDVDILPGGPDNSPPQILAAHGADVMVDWMPSALAVRERGVPAVNIAQIFQRSGLMMVCRSDTVKTPADFKGKIIGAWFGGNEYPFLAWMQRLGYSISGPNRDITVLKQGYSIDPLLQRQAACIAGMSYNETYQIPKAGLKDKDVVWFSYQDSGVGTLEDGLYALQSIIADPAGFDRLARFVAGSIKGWDYAVKHQDEAVDIVMAHDTGGNLTRPYQIHMMREVAKLVGSTPHGTGYLDPADYERTVKVLMTGGSDPVISKPPTGAWTHDVFDAAAKYLGKQTSNP